MACPKCGYQTAPGARFCKACGTPIAAAPAGGAVQQGQGPAHQPPRSTHAAQPQQPRAAAPQQPARPAAASKLNLERFRSWGEHNLTERLRQDMDFMRRMNSVIQQQEEYLVKTKLRLMTNCYRVDPDLTPLLHQLAGRVQQNLGLAQPLDIFIISNPELNAFCVSAKKNARFIMCVNSGLIEMLKPEELLFVMGHEAGHAILGHGHLPIIDINHPDFSLLEVIQLRSLSRRQEISSDRIGLLTCRDPRAAGSALFKIATGLSERWGCFNEAACARHFDEISQSVDIAAVSAGLGTHPMTPLRMKALMAFSGSDIYQKAVGGSAVKITTDQLERMIEDMLLALDPDMTEMNSPGDAELTREFLFKGVLLVIGADGVIDTNEVAWLKSVWKDANMKEIRKKMEQPDFVEQTLRELERSAAAIREKMSELSRLGLFRTLMDAAMCSGGLADTEFQVLEHLRAILDIRLEFARKVFEASTREFTG